jgi:hypothetical protein
MQVQNQNIQEESVHTARVKIAQMPFLQIIDQICAQKWSHFVWSLGGFRQDNSQCANHAQIIPLELDNVKQSNTCPSQQQ